MAAPPHLLLSEGILMKGSIAGSLAVAACLVISGHALQQQPGTIRTGITSVPIDVRVVDRDGKPVTDLKLEHFTILEDGAPQRIRHFSKHAFTPDRSAVRPEPSFRTAESVPQLATENRRVFLIVLGRGRHQDVSKYVDALARFIDQRVLPQDQIALLAWNLTTDFTTNHALIRRTVERYRDRHAHVEKELTEWFSGLRAVYGSRDIPPHIQREIDGVFEGAVVLRPRELTPGQITSTERIAEANRQAAGDLLRDTLVATGEPSILAAPLANRMIDVTLNELLTIAPQLNHDLGNLYTGIDYLRHLEGEKHLVLLTQRGVSMSHLEMNAHLARMASDGRIALNIIRTGGTVGVAPLAIGARGGIVMETLPTPRAVFAEGFAVQDLRLMADSTGGQLHAFRKADDAFRRFGDGAGFQYLLAYYPSNATWDGKFREVAIKVNRPGVRVMHRQGYFATNQIVPLDKRQFMTANRIDAAAQYGGIVDHIRVTVKQAVSGGSGTARALTAHVTVDISRVKFAREADVNVATLDVALYCGDDKGRIVGQLRQTVDLKLTDAVRESLLKDGASFASRVPLTADPDVLKVIVYDYGADLIGTAIAKTR